MIPPSQRRELLEPGHRTTLPAPRPDPLLQRRVVQLALRTQQSTERLGLPTSRLQHRLKRTKHNTTMNKGYDSVTPNRPSPTPGPRYSPHEQLGGATYGLGRLDQEAWRFIGGPGHLRESSPP
jgi:hypothetical protein